MNEFITNGWTLFGRKKINKQKKKISVCIQAPTAHSMSTYVIDRNKQIYNKYTPQNSCHFQNKKKKHNLAITLTKYRFSTNDRM